VFGEVIALSLISVAKRTAQNGDEVATKHVLEHACRALTLVASLGAAFVLAFDEPIFRILLGPDFRESALALAPYMVVASVFLVFRSFYFGQVIYFAGSSRLDIYAAAVLLAATGAISVLLVPIHGIFGAAYAQACGQVLACLVFVVAGRRLYRMPVPLADMAAIAAIAALCWGASLLVDYALALGELPRIAIKLVLFSLAFSGTVWRFNIVGLADAIRVFGQKAAR
jgi:O-antigen/teichoic acid export membrane protein